VGKPTGFIEYDRKDAPKRPVEERIADYEEIEQLLAQEDCEIQAARCMDCGIPYCHAFGCPLGNRIPDFNDMIYRKQWRRALALLESRNNFPEITGRICPAPCETACSLSINAKPVTIRELELALVERGWREGWIRPQPAKQKTGRSVAVIGSGPAGLAAAQQLVRAGHDVVVFEKDNRVGGLLRYGIPDFKLDKKILDRRLEQMWAEGVKFQTDVCVGEDVSLKYLRQRFDAILLAMGADEPRDLGVVGRGLENIHFAMEYLAQQNRINAGEDLRGVKRIDAGGKVVVVIGGGDTGSDCVGTARRQGAKEICQFEILPKPPENANPQTPWPLWPQILRTSSSQEEGCIRRWCVLTKRFTGVGVRVGQLHGCEVQWIQTGDRWEMKEIPGTEFSLNVDLVLLAMGFTHVVHRGLIEKLGLKLEPKGNLAVGPDDQTSDPGIFAAGDSVAGASLVVRAIAAGRKAAASIDCWLEGCRSSP
jgi:NAD(P)H-dependent glutamate synthase small subunit